MGLPPLQMEGHWLLVQLSAACPPWMPQCTGSSVGAMDSKEENTDAPNSEAYTPYCAVPRVVPLARDTGRVGAKSPLLEGPLTAGQLPPCW